MTRIFANGWTGGQYSVYRVLVGLALAVSAILRLSRDTGSPAVEVPLLIAALFFGFGCRDRIAALAALAALAARVVVDELPWGDASLFLVGPLVIHLFVPPAPYGSWDRRGQADPGTDWHMPPAVYLLAWVTIILVEGSAFLPAHRAMFIVWPLYAVCAFIPKIRKYAWAAAFGIFFTSPLIPVGDQSTWAVLLHVCLIHLLLFDPAWVKSIATQEPEVVFYDGSCGLCHRTVRWVLAEDRRESPFRFGTLDGETLKSRLPEERIRELPDSLVMLTGDGQVLVRSSAVAHIMRHLGGLWRVLGCLLAAIPRPVRDLGYGMIAAIRHKLFRKPSGACPLSPPELRSRFLP